MAGLQARERFEQVYFDRAQYIAERVLALRGVELDASGNTVGDHANGLAVKAWIAQRRFLEKGKFDAHQESLWVYASVARSVPPLMRIKALRFQHHQLVAPLPAQEQKMWLEKAAKTGLTVKTLRTFIQTAKGKMPVPRKRTLKMVKEQLDLVIKDCRDLPGLEDVVKAIDDIQTGS